MSTNVTKTVNGIQIMSSCFNPEAERIGKTFAYCLLFLVSLVGNSFIGAVVYRTKTLRKPINVLIVNMVMSDLLYPIFLLPEKLITLYSGSWLVSGPLGQALCKLDYFLRKTFPAVSIQSLGLIAVDRFGAVVFPLRSPLISSKRCRFVILATWINAFAVWVPELFARKVIKYRGELVCVRQWNGTLGKSLSYENYAVAIIVVFLYAPLVLIGLLYFGIALKIKSQKIPGEQSVNTTAKRLKAERNVLKMSSAIVSGFIMCWLPYSIWWFLTLYSSDLLSSCGFQYFTGFAFFLAHSNCAINPIICFVFCRNYRQGLKNFFGCFFVGPQRVDKIVS